jgi:hypothetical protein
MEQLELKFDTKEIAREQFRLASYIADYIAEEISRGKKEIDKWVIWNAIDAYDGGADLSKSRFIGKNKSPIFTGKIKRPVKI